MVVQNTNKNTAQNLPPLPDKAPGINGYNYKPSFGVIVLCNDEEHHKKVFEKLSCDGYKCKVVRI